MRTPPRVEFLKRDKWPLEGSGVGGGRDGWGRRGGGTEEGVGRALGARSQEPVSPQAAVSVGLLQLQVGLKAFSLHPYSPAGVFRHTT